MFGVTAPSLVGGRLERWTIGPPLKNQGRAGKGMGMDGGSVPPCSDLGQSVEHSLLQWLGRKANRRGIVPMDYDRLEDRMYREEGIRYPREMLRHLIDGDYIEKAHEGEPIRFRILVKCLCREDCFAPRGEAAGGTSLAAKPLGTRPDRAELRRPKAGEAEASQRITSCLTTPPSRKRWPPNMELARNYFPQLLRQHGVAHALAVNDHVLFSRRLLAWHDNDGLSYTTIQLMMQEFARHPEWYRNARSMPWRVFVYRAGDIHTLILYQQRKDPSNRRFSNGHTGEGSYWNRRPTPRTSFVS